MGGSDERDTVASPLLHVPRDGSMRFFTFNLLLVQVFHICASNGHGGHIKHSFLCPNGTLFQQQVRMKGKGTFCQEEYGAFLSHDIEYVTICQEENGAFLLHDKGFLNIYQEGYWSEVICRKIYETF
jgi:hypothetical protein